MGKRYSLDMGGKEAIVVLDGGGVTIDGVEALPTSASLDSRRKVPFWVLTVMVTLILTAGTFGAVAVHSLLFSPIIALFAISVCLFVFLATGRREKVLVIGTGDGPIELSGPFEDLKGLHFELAKIVLGRSRGQDDVHAAGPRARGGSPERAGSTRAESVMGPEEARRLKDDLGRRVVKRDRIVARTCPHCEGNDLYIEGGMYGGAIYHCKDCDYVGPFIIERELTVK